MQAARGCGGGEGRGGAFIPGDGRGESGEEGPGDDEELGPSAELLLKLLPEAPAPQILKARPVVVKKIKMQPQFPQGERQSLPQATEHSMLCPSPQPS